MLCCRGILHLSAILAILPVSSISHTASIINQTASIINQPYCQYHQQARIQPCHNGGSFYSDFGPFPGLTIGLTSGCLGETSILQFVFVLSTELVLRDVFGHTGSLQWRCLILALILYYVLTLFPRTQYLCMSSLSKFFGTLRQSILS